MKGKKVRVRSKRLETFDQSKMAVAIWLMARELVEDKTTPPAGEKKGPAASTPQNQEAA